MSEVLSFLLGTSLQENPRNSNEPAKDFGNAFRASCCPFQSCELGIAQLMTKQTTITIETKSLLVLCSRSSRRAWCPVCGVEAEVIVVERGLLSSQEAPAVDQLLNSGEVHGADAPVPVREQAHRVMGEGVAAYRFCTFTVQSWHC